MGITYWEKPALIQETAVLREKQNKCFICVEEGVDEILPEVSDIK